MRPAEENILIWQLFLLLCHLKIALACFTLRFFFLSTAVFPPSLLSSSRFTFSRGNSEIIRTYYVT